MSKKYFGKILLFGEYSIICGSRGLVVPYNKTSGSWSFSDMLDSKNHFAKQSSNHLWDFLTYLQKQEQLHELLDLPLMKQELDKGLYFHSDIPQGYGAGSSGALVAAVFDRFAKLPLEKEPKKLRRIFALAESYFHGSSSGIDPLACYLSESLLIGPHDDIEIVENPIDHYKESDLKVFLLDTASVGNTAPLVNRFRERLHEYKFFRLLREVYIPATNLAIDQFRGRNQNAMMDTLTKIAEFQREEMSEMIPKGFEGYFSEATKEQPFTLKICGSGGGGYLLGFTFEKSKTADFLNDKGIKSPLFL